MANEGVQNGLISGFSKKSKQEKIEWITNKCFSNPTKPKSYQTYWNSDEQLQNLHDEFIENAISNFYLPLSCAQLRHQWEELCSSNGYRRKLGGCCLYQCC